MNKKDIKYFEVAKSLSLLSSFHREHIGAIIVLKNEIIAVGQNMQKSHPIQAYWAGRANNPNAIYIHAEISCLTKLNTDIDLSAAKFYIFRQNRQNEVALAKPCNSCRLAIVSHGIKAVSYTHLTLPTKRIV